MNRKSEIFENFVKIAQEKKLISDEGVEKTIEKLKKDKRADSLSKEDIEKLYNIKPNTSKGMEYENNIMEIAHKDSLVLSPSYDKLNGLIENNIERQNIIMNIVKKKNTGNHTKHKYAQTQLIKSILKVSSLLDNQKQKPLQSFAKTCVFELEKKAQGAAAVIFGSIGIGVSVALLGILYAQQHLQMINEGFETNLKNLKSEVSDLLDGETWYGTGYEINNDLKSDLQEFLSNLDKYQKVFDEVKESLHELQKPRTGKELIELGSHPDASKYIASYKLFKQTTDNFKLYLEKMKTNFSSETYKASHIQDKGWFTSLVDKTQILHGGKGLVADDFDDIVRAIKPFQKSVDDTLSVLNEANTFSQRVAQEILQVSSKEEEPKVPAKYQATVRPENKTKIDDEISELDNLTKDF